MRPNDRAAGGRRHALAAVMATVGAVGLAACGSSSPPSKSSSTSASSASPPAATVVARRRVAPRVLDLTVRSPALGHTARVRLLTPDGWAPGRTQRRWPVLYLLHGCCDTYDSWTRSTRVEQMRGLRDVLVVMPEGGAVGFYSNWRNGGRGGPPAWETFHLVELRELLERDFGAGPRRAVAGLSMGGLGAMAYAARRRGMFAAAASFSGLLHPLGDRRLMLGLLRAHTRDPFALWGRPGARDATWAAHDPTELADRLRGIALFVSAGTGEPGPFEPGRTRPDRTEATVHRESRAFVARLRRLGIPAQIDFYGRGVHDWPYWERELGRALPLLRRALGRPPLHQPAAASRSSSTSS